MVFISVSFNCTCSVLPFCIFSIRIINKVENIYQLTERTASCCCLTTQPAGLQFSLSYFVSAHFNSSLPFSTFLIFVFILCLLPFLCTSRGCIIELGTNSATSLTLKANSRTVSQIFFTSNEVSS